MEKTPTKIIAKNTMLLYFRMALITIIGLYTSRVILQTLGVEDFGIYNVAGSVVALFGFITSALGQASSRHITVEIGKAKDGDICQLVKCFQTTRTIHGILAILIFILCETLGIWILYRSAIPEGRMVAAFWVFQISVVTAVLNVTQVPFTAIIIAHEKMAIYAYISIFEVVANLLVCYLLLISPIDKLVYYALLIFAVRVAVLLMYRFYCKRQFKECSLAYGFDKSFFRPILSFSFWNLFGSLSYSALTQGSTILVNLFFGPTVVAGRAMANTVRSHVINFVTNFRMAINPQILKRNAAGEIDSYKRLLLWSSNISFYLMLALVLPLFFSCDFILALWLKDVPPYTSPFLKIALIEMLLYVYDVSFYQIFQAEGRLKENAIICPIMDIIGLGVVYLVYLLGGSVLSIAWMMLVLTAAQGMLVKPILAIKMFGYSWTDFLGVFLNNLKVTVIAIALPIVSYFIFKHTVSYNVCIILLSVISVLISSFYFGMTRAEREKIVQLVRSKFKKTINS